MKIAVCAGHEDKARGATNRRHGLTEHGEAKKILTPLMLQLVSQGHQVTNIQGSLSEKVKLINEGDFDLALDLHFNADADHLDPEDLDDSRGHGAMVMYCPRADQYRKPEPASQCREQADAFSFAMSAYLGGHDRGGRPGWYWGSNPPTAKDYFLRKTNCMAFIPEPGYIDNNAFAEKWLVAGRHDQIAAAIALGIEELV